MWDLISLVRKASLGHGYLVLVLIVAIGAGMEWSVETLFEDDTYYQNQAWPLSVAMALAGTTTFVLGRHLNGRSVIGPDHWFFFLPMHYWGPILIGAAAINLVRLFL